MGHKASMFKSFEIDLKFGIFFFGGGGFESLLELREHRKCLLTTKL
jgi:hypothetical protein